ncbi:hypothetical protein Sme01_02700 [Sphaerisporangium melleum]|uniref:Peptidase C51 domain-containing protein n=1 Tax=Sphaerisporangium melleum TaxID=321316 RepID=A0A917VBW9_9ACTN|nr:CHAP domain-containing protein [Sphaerisporangium melleum]GGK61077.1 hypothetical protein GCM10007964_00240 [Sphaerisporangium melleum]GII67794.1 hypothetical protein Sme01_02700 [Sphaerisporangium melleum]
MTTLERVRREVQRHIGYREHGTNDTPFNREFGKLPGYPADGYGYPWCHTFVSVCLGRAGLSPDVEFPWTAGCGTGVTWFRARGRFGTVPREGALVYYGPGGGTHVEWVEKVTPGEITTIGGNTSGSLDGRYFNGDGVYRKTVARSSPRIYGYGYPDYEGDDMPSAKEVADAVVERLTYTLTKDLWAVREGLFPEGQKIDPKTFMRQVWAYGKDGYNKDREILARLDAQNEALKAMAEALAAKDAAVDPDALVARIREAIEHVTIRLDAGPEKTD